MVRVYIGESAGTAVWCFGVDRAQGLVSRSVVEGVAKMLASYWYVIALGLAALFGAWVALGQPGMPPDEEEQASVNVELTSALLEGEPDRLSQLEQQSGLKPGGGTRALSERFQLLGLELEPMPWLGPRVARGRARIAILGGAQPALYVASFGYAWESTGKVTTTVHGQHVSQHGVTGQRAVLSDLRFESAR